MNIDIKKNKESTMFKYLNSGDIFEFLEYADGIFIKSDSGCAIRLSDGYNTGNGGLGVHEVIDLTGKYHLTEGACTNE